VQYAMRKVAGHGFRPVIPPVLVREEPMFRTGFVTRDSAQIYEVAGDDLYLVGTSEVALASLHAGEILEELPRRYAGFSSCFRREAGAAGKDTRGIFRVHQFDKVEMFSFVAPDESRDEHERLLAIEEEILQELEIPYRVVNIGVGDLVLLEFALVRWALEKLGGYGFEPVIPPVLVREDALLGTGFLPDTEQQIYHLPEDDLYLVGTSEVALASLHAGEILEELPRRYAGFSSCFRREAGAAGKDTRGIFRVHQFDKLEMFSFVAPDESRDEHERLLAIEEEILQELEIPYRVVNIGVGDLGASAAKKYDCEAWMPGQARYREVTSTSNTTDFQARRLQIRYRAGEGERPEVLHTLNGTAVTWRHMIALLENGQRDDGSVTLPAVLAEYGAPASLPAPTAPR
jgi:seryl-tRNA synthetase